MPLGMVPDKIVATILNDDSETALEWIKLWMEVRRMEGYCCNFEESCSAWFKMHTRKENLDETVYSHISER